MSLFKDEAQSSLLIHLNSFAAIYKILTKHVLFHEYENKVYVPFCCPLHYVPHVRHFTLEMGNVPPYLDCTPGVALQAPTD